MRIECSSEAYERLIQAGIEEKLIPLREEIQKIFLHRTILDGKTGEIVEQATKNSPDSYTPASIQDIQRLEKLLEKGDCFDIKGEALGKHPFLLAKLVFGNETREPEKFGFASEEEFAQAVTAYCIGEHNTTFSRGDNYAWRNRERKNEIYLMTHGDTAISQTDIKGKTPLLQDPPSKGFTMIQDASPFLAGVLRYAQELEQTDIPEITHWPILINQARNPWGDYSYSEWKERGKEITWESRIAMQVYLINTRRKIPETFFPARIPSRNGSEIFIKMQGENLCLYLPQEDQRTYPPTEGKKIATYTPQDLKYLLNGMYKLFARSRSQMCQMMQIFTEENEIQVQE